MKKQLLPSKIYSRLISAHIIIPASLKLGYQHYYAQNYLNALKLLMLISLVLFLSFGLLDVFLLKMDLMASELQTILKIRFGLGLPLLGGHYLFTMTPRFRQFHQPVAVSYILTMSMLLWFMMERLSDPVLQDVYFMGLMITLLSGLIVSRIQVVPALIGCSLLSIVLMIGYSGSSNISVQNIWIQPFFLSVTVLLGLFACLSNEIHIRNHYFRLRDIKAEENRLKKDNRSLYQLAQYDGLTGLANRRHFEYAFAKEWRRAERNRSPIAICMIDTDNFKAYNDHYGHQEGDQCLMKLGALLADVGNRPGDIVARYGGEEFVLLLPGADLQSALKIAERVRQSVVELGVVHEFSSVGSVVTVSIGVAHEYPLPGFGESLAMRAALVRRADEALYAAKHSGKNCVAASTEECQELVMKDPQDSEHQYSNSRKKGEPVNTDDLKAELISE